LEAIRDFIQSISSVEGITEIIRWGGLSVLVAIVFAETGLLVGFFLPGDSLLITAGFVASTTDVLRIETVIPALVLAAVAGNEAGYTIGRKAGQALYNRPQSRWFRRDQLLKTRAFYDKYGPATLVLSRFVPFARTFAPVVAGIGEMDRGRFFLYNVVGAVGWVLSMTLLGYYFGQIPFVKEHIEKVILVIIALSVLPVALHALRSRKGH
jgi:membrane-associated protein